MNKEIQHRNKGAKPAVIQARPMQRQKSTNNFEAVLLKQNELLERFLESAGTNMLAERSGMKMNVLSPSIGHPVSPIAYDFRRLYQNYGSNYLKAKKSKKFAKGFARVKAPGITGPLGSTADHHPLYTLGFFQDCALARDVWSTLVQPRDSIINLIPVRGNNNVLQKFGFITQYTVADTVGETEPTDSCDACISIDETLDACKISYPYGRLCRRTKTLETNELIRRACFREYDDFLFMGDLRGEEVFPVHFGLGEQVDQNFIKQGAVRRQLFNLGRHFQLWMLSKVWTGDPANNSGDAYKEFYGLANLIRNDWGEVANTIPLESMTGTEADCSALNSDIKDFGGGCVNGPPEVGAPLIWQLLQEMEDTLYRRAQALGVLPVQLGIFMISPLWNELSKVIPCQMAGDGCVTIGGAAGTVPTLNINDGGSGLFNLSMREQMLRSQSLTINGRTYPVYLDDSLPYTLVDGNYLSDIWFVPFTAMGEEVLYWEHMDYSELGTELAPIPGTMNDMLGWSDDGRFHHVITYERWCFELQSKMEPRLIFKAPHLAGRIQNVGACPLQAKPMAFDGAGTYAPTLGGTTF